jgi:hypothetical protein
MLRKASGMPASSHPHHALHGVALERRVSDGHPADHAFYPAESCVWAVLPVTLTKTRQGPATINAAGPRHHR